LKLVSRRRTKTLAATLPVALRTVPTTAPVAGSVTSATTVCPAATVVCIVALSHVPDCELFMNPVTL
jgi:hypothetical protein